MASFAQVNANNIVINVIALDDSLELTGVEYLTENFKHDGTWVQTSRNTHAGVHTNKKTPLHKNYAGIGYTFDGTGFAAPQPFASWTKNLETYFWEPPTPMPVVEGKTYQWIEDDLNWQEVVFTQP